MNTNSASHRSISDQRRPYLVPSLALLAIALVAVFSGEERIFPALQTALPITGLILSFVAGLLARVRRPAHDGDAQHHSQSVVSARSIRTEQF